MATATSPRTLTQEITDRALTEFDNPATVTASTVEEAMDYIVDMVAGDYRVMEDPDAVDSHVVGAAWEERIREQLLVGIMDDVRATLFPLAAARLVGLLRRDPPPAHLVAHEDATVLRADLHLLDATAE